MWGAYIRAVLTIGMIAIGSAVMRAVAPYLLQYQGAPDSLLYRTFAGIIDYIFVLGLLAIGVTLIARAVTESQVGVRR
jgi:hypothetical protein